MATIRTDRPSREHRCKSYSGPQTSCRNHPVAKRFVVVVVALFVFGCGSTSMPMPVLQAQQSCDAATVLPYSIRVMPAQYPVYTLDLIKTLETTALFEKVLGPDDPETADLEATVERLIHGEAKVPILTILTLGIVPTIFTEEYGHEFSIAAPGLTHVSPILIDTTFKANSWLGWLGGLRAISPRATLGNPARSSVYFSNLRAAICNRTQELHAMAAR